MIFPSRKVVALAGAIGGACLIGSSHLAVAQSMFDPTPIRARWQAHLAGSVDDEFALWDVLMVQAWLQDRTRPA